MSLVWLAIAVLGVWRITHLVAAEDGPRGAIARLRTLARGNGLQDLLECFYCASLWVAVPFALALGGTWLEQLMLWPALSGAAVVLERLIERASPTGPAAYTEEPQTAAGEHDMLPR
ncbi:MAG TPA: hypothetical protein VFJ20_06000 [Gemmatimonadaceae bacterium]|nr:hypothetical protein [Gemmatimonadaceae bacterium]